MRQYWVHDAHETKSYTKIHWTNRPGLPSAIRETPKRTGMGHMMRRLTLSEWRVRCCGSNRVNAVVPARPACEAALSGSRYGVYS